MEPITQINGQGHILDQDTKEYIKALISGVNARIEANHTLTMAEFAHVKEDLVEVKKKQDITNGRIGKLEKVTEALTWIVDHKIVAVAIAVIFWFVIDWSADHVNYKKTIENTSGIEINR